VIVTYAFRNALAPGHPPRRHGVFVSARLQTCWSEGFAWPGIGSYAVRSAARLRLSPVQGFVLTMAVMYVALNLLIDVLYGLIDPRVRLEA